MRWPRGLAVLGIVVATSAGACQQEWDGELPPPAAVGAAPFADGATIGGLDAVYATLFDTSRRREGGRDVVERCYTLLRLRPDGVAETSEACTQGDDLGELAMAPATWTRPYFVGDYARIDGVITVRMVDWDVISEELVLSERSSAYCVAGLYGPTFAGDVAVAATLVAGNPPPDAPPCD